MTESKHFESLTPENAREKEIKEYLEFLKKGLSAQLIGLPGSGKANVLRLLAYNTSLRNYHFKSYERKVHFVFIDCLEVKNRSTVDIAKHIFTSIAFSLNERLMTQESNEIKSLLKEGLSYNDDLLLSQYLKKAIDFLSIEKKLTVILLFDKFDLIAPNLTEYFFSNLKTLRDHAKYRFGTIFSLKRPLEETVDIKILVDFQDIVSGNEIYTSIYDPVSLSFRLDYIEKASRMTVDKKMREEIIKLTGGHSKLTKLSFESLLSENTNISELKDCLLSKSSIKIALKEIWDCLMSSEKEALKLNLPFETVLATHPYLIKSGLITEEGISIPLFNDYINSININLNDPLTYDPEKNEVLKGNIALSQNLSSLEFKLLKFMIENKGKVLAKDEIIREIWSDQKTQEGVTDQAFDQIIYRLRKKIETDPSNPQLIQTIKGTGYKFSDN